MQLILHIGTDKTGSTAIQEHLYCNRDWFLAQNVYLPATGLGKDSGHAALFVGDGKWALDAVLQELETARVDGFDTALLSWEGLHSLRAPAINRLISRFGAMELRVLVYLREQAEIVQSGFLQEVKKQENRFPMSVFWQRRPTLQHPRFLSARYPRLRNYSRLLRRWERALARMDTATTITARPYTARLWLNGDLLDDFLMQLGLTASSGFERLGANSNVSLDAESGQVLDNWRRQGVAKNELRRLVDVALSLIIHDGARSRYFLDAPTVEAIRRHYRSSNNRWSRVYLGANCAPFDYTEPCARQVGESAWRDSVASAQAAIRKLDQVPTHEGPAVSGMNLSRVVALSAGWSTAEDWGYWSNAQCSIMRFRLFRQHLLPGHRGLQLYLRGRYYGDNESTRVRVNGVDLGRWRLGHEQPGIFVTLEHLARYEVLVIELEHQQPVSPCEGGADGTMLAYGLESVGYDLV